MTNLLNRPEATTARRGLLAVMCACVVLVVGMVAAVNLAVPVLAASPLHPSAAMLVWIVDTYVIFFACLVIPGGAAGDRFGRKGVLLAGLGLFALGAALSTLAPNLAVLLAGRAITGVGAAAVLPNTLAVLLHAVPAQRRAATIGTWASMTGIGGVLGNVGGGAVLSGGSWRWLFGAAVPIAVLLAVFVARIAPVSGRGDRRVDPLGTLLLVGACVALLVGIVQGPEAGWGSPVVLGGFGCAVVLCAAWTLVELRAEHPLLDPRLFRIADLRRACLGMTAVFFGMFALFYVNASFLQYGKGFSVLLTGLGILPLTVPMILFARHAAELVRRIGLTATLASAFAFVGGGLLGLSTSDTATPYAVYAGWLVVTGIGVALALPTLSGVIANSLPHAQAGVSTGLQATTREFGSALGVAVVGTVLAAFTRGHPHADAAAFVAGMSTGLRVIGTTVLVLGGLILLPTRRAHSSSTAPVSR